MALGLVLEMWTGRCATPESGLAMTLSTSPPPLLPPPAKYHTGNRCYILQQELEQSKNEQVGLGCVGRVKKLAQCIINNMDQITHSMGQVGGVTTSGGQAGSQEAPYNFLWLVQRPCSMLVWIKRRIFCGFALIWGGIEALGGNQKAKVWMLCVGGEFLEGLGLCGFIRCGKIQCHISHHLSFQCFQQTQELNQAHSIDPSSPPVWDYSKGSRVGGEIDNYTTNNLPPCLYKLHNVFKIISGKTKGPKWLELEGRLRQYKTNRKNRDYIIYPPHNSQNRTLRTRISKTIREEERNGKEKGLPQVLQLAVEEISRDLGKEAFTAGAALSAARERV
ncbi:hypothetical protein VP01_90g2 [Puccinia sorghi]|uniref:Uncharacterized protein n=1 Tax=Puccinia sorghi TaxID=27349 RepID=A0A0L6U876_9BASI|nr:hypothetical protein VP01_90g2 [Puccinia sorghi]